MSRAVKGIIFDLDGVITDTANYHYLAWKRISDELGIYFDRQINERLKGIDRMSSLEIILERSKANYTPEQKLEITRKKNVYYVEYIDGITSRDLFPGVKELLKNIRALGISIALGSASKNAPIIIRKLGIMDLFDAVVNAEHIKKGKPDPEIFITAAEMTGLLCADCAVVEDSLAGIRAAKAAGMTAVAIGSPDLLPGADLYYPATGEIKILDLYNA